MGSNKRRQISEMTRGINDSQRLYKVIKTLEESLELIKEGASEEDYLLDKGRNEPDCVAYIFGRKKPSTHPIFKKLMDKADFIDNPQNEDLIWYLDEDNEPMHIGKVVGDNRVLSKWGCGPVLVHPEDFTPHYYGTKVLYSRPLEGKVVDDVWTVKTEKKSA